MTESKPKAVSFLDAEKSMGALMALRVSHEIQAFWQAFRTHKDLTESDLDERTFNRWVDDFECLTGDIKGLYEKHGFTPSPNFGIENYFTFWPLTLDLIKEIQDKFRKQRMTKERQALVRVA